MRQAFAFIPGRPSLRRDQATMAIGLLVALAWLWAWPLASQAEGSGVAMTRYTERGPHQVEKGEIEVSRPGSGGSFDARVFIPLPVEVDEAGLERSPIFAFGHGYLAPIEVYESTLEHLASWGITAVAPRSGRELLPSHERFGADLVAALDEVATIASNEGWRGVPVDPAARAVGGHSMGGGAAVLATAMDPSIRTVATVNAADTRPSAVAAAEGVTVPMLLVAGSEDRITPIDQHQRPMFEAAGGPAQLRTLQGGGHCGTLDQADLIGLVCGRSSLPNESQRTLAQAALTAWLRGQTMADGAAAEAVWQPDPEGRIAVEIRNQEPA